MLATSPVIDLEKRIDCIFVCGPIPVDVWVSESLASDHRMVLVKVAIF